MRRTNANSIPALMLETHDANPNRISFYEKVDGRWVGRIAGDNGVVCRELTAGLKSLAVEPGDRVAILSASCPDWSAADLAILSCGAVTVGMYSSSTAEQVHYLLDHSGSKVVFVSDASQLAKVREVADRLSEAPRVVMFDAVPDGDEALSMEALKAMGRSHSAAGDAAWRAGIAAIERDDIATIVYTSGTTGPPKGAVLSHGNLLAAIEATLQVLPADESDVGLSFLPLAHSLQRQANYAGLLSGATGAFCSNLDHLMDEFVEIRPTVQASVPRIWEKFHTRLQSRLAAASPTRRAIAGWAFSVAAEHGRRLRAGQRIPRRLRLQYRIADRVVFTKLRAIFGGRVRYLLSGGAPIALELLEFFDNVGLRIYEGWGLTETAAPASINHPGAWRFGTVGRPLPGVQVRIAQDGEIEVSGPNVFSGYYRDDIATKAAFTEDGWFKTGDIGEIDADGFLKITDRKKNLIITSGGKNVAPQNIENLIKADGLISQAVVIGDRRKYLTALVTIDVEELPAWAERNGLPSGLDQLLEHPTLLQHVEKAVERANGQLARYEQIKRFAVLPRDLSQEHDELTPTLKVKRRVVEARFADEIERLYS